MVSFSVCVSNARGLLSADCTGRRGKSSSPSSERTRIGSVIGFCGTSSLKPAALEDFWLLSTGLSDCRLCETFVVSLMVDFEFAAFADSLVPEEGFARFRRGEESCAPGCP